MKNKVSKIVALLVVCCMLFSLAACGNRGTTANVGNAGGNLSVFGDLVNKIPTNTDDAKKADNVIDSTNIQLGTEVNNTSEEKKDENPSTTVENVFVSSPKGEYNEGVVLVKLENNFDVSAFGNLEYTSAEALYSGSKWYSIKLTDSSATEEAVTYLTNLGTFDKVDYDYVMGVTAKEQENPDYDKQTNLGLSNIPHGWTVNGKAPGGSPDVVVAVIDTGVDYNHLDLRNNIWVNTAEIPDNGRDDDGNGYVDDI